MPFNDLYELLHYVQLLHWDCNTWFVKFIIANYISTSKDINP